MARNESDPNIVPKQPQMNVIIQEIYGYLYAFKNNCVHTQYLDQQLIVVIPFSELEENIMSEKIKNYLKHAFYQIVQRFKTYKTCA